MTKTNVTYDADMNIESVNIELSSSFDLELTADEAKEVLAILEKLFAKPKPAYLPFQHHKPDTHTRTITGSLGPVWHGITPPPEYLTTTSSPVGPPDIQCGDN